MHPPAALSHRDIAEQLRDHGREALAQAIALMVQADTGRYYNTTIEIRLMGNDRWCVSQVRRDLKHFG